MPSGLDMWDSAVAWIRAGRATGLRDLALEAPGNAALSNEAILQPSADWRAFRDQVLTPAGIAHCAWSAHSLPFQARQTLEFCYSFAELETPLPSRFAFDIATLPFAIIWMMRFGIIDRYTAQEWLDMIAGLTPVKLFIIREIVTIPRYNASIMMDHSGLSKRTLDNHLYQISEILNERVPRHKEAKGYGSILVDIAKNYGFLAHFGQPVF